MRRLFVALALPAPVRERLAQLQSGLERVRWVEPENFHLTLRFVGEVDDGTADDLDASLTGLTAPSFSLGLSGIGHFEKRGHPSAVWAGVAPNPALNALQQRVEAATRRAGLPAEGRKFRPHVTLARFRGDVSSVAVARWIERVTPFRIEAFPVTEMTLFRSTLGHAGPTYTVENVYPLEGLPDADTVAGLWDEDDG